MAAIKVTGLTERVDENQLREFFSYRRAIGPPYAAHGTRGHSFRRRPQHAAQTGAPAGRLPGPPGARAALRRPSMPTRHAARLWLQRGRDHG